MPPSTTKTTITQSELEHVIRDVNVDDEVVFGSTNHEYKQALTITWKAVTEWINPLGEDWLSGYVELRTTTDTTLTIPLPPEDPPLVRINDANYSITKLAIHEPETHICPDCGDSFDSYLQLTGHLNNPHTDCTRPDESQEGSTSEDPGESGIRDELEDELDDALNNEPQETDKGSRGDRPNWEPNTTTQGEPKKNRCQNCGAHVSPEYARVMDPEENESTGPRQCPQCPDLIRDGASIREARSPRHRESAENAKMGRGGIE